MYQTYARFIDHLDPQGQKKVKILKMLVHEISDPDHGTINFAGGRLEVSKFGMPSPPNLAHPQPADNTSAALRCKTGRRIAKGL
eukprot:gene26011-biopygen12906